MVGIDSTQVHGWMGTEQISAQELQLFSLTETLLFLLSPGRERAVDASFLAGQLLSAPSASLHSPLISSAAPSSPLTGLSSCRSLTALQN